MKKSQNCTTRWRGYPEAKSCFLLLTCTFAFCLLPFNFALAAVPIDPILYPEGAPTVGRTEPNIEGNEQERKERAAVGYDEYVVRTQLAGKITNFILGIAGIVAIFFIINNAWFLIASGGKEETITQHKKGLMWAIVGLILIILSYSIIRFIISIPFQADQPTPGPPPAAAGTTP